MIFAAIAIVFVLLVSSEVWWRKQRPHGEFSRKFVHITVGSFVAFWPYFLSANEIRLLALAFLIGVLVSKQFHVFSAIHSVQRPTLGEVWFALVVGILAILAGHPHIYTIALLEMSLADGLAAIIGTRFGSANRYVVFGSPKSIVGTLTFFVVSCALLGLYEVIAPGMLPVALIPLVALGATLLENVGVRGLDNLLVPLFVAGVLRLFA
ncbi:MAG: phytol kinase [Candidatus Saccharibacteria bacterium]|nr:phytol kinase [Candidatus Saccharibacteria bacterium]